jgi:hypothetical protein
LLKLSSPCRVLNRLLLGDDTRGSLPVQA